MIYLNENAAKKLPGKTSLFLSCGYNPQVVDIIKMLQERNWDKETKLWEIPVYAFSDVLNKLIMIDSVKITLLKDAKKKNVSIPADYHFKLQPFKHQLAAIEYGLQHNSWILGDEQGLGKTLSTIHLALILRQTEGLKHCLVVCGKNSLKYNWAEEIKKHSDADYKVLGERIRVRSGVSYIGSVQERLDDLKSNISEFFIITNIETLRDKSIVAEINKKKLGIEMIVLDEAHVIKNPTSEQGKNMLKLTNFKRKIALSGTIILNSPIEAYVPLKWTDNESSSYTYFKNRYCIYDGSNFYQIIGYKNLDQLNHQISECMLRRTKDEVLDLPPKIYSYDYVEMTLKQAKLYDDVKSAIKDDIDKVKLSRASILAAVTRFRQATSYTGILSTSVEESAKIDRLCDLVAEITAQGDKVLVYTIFKETGRYICQRLAKYGPLLATGDVSDSDIQIIKDKFTNNIDNKVLVATWQKLGTGHTLTAASYVIFVDTPWTAGDFEQCVDRVHRIGTSKTVNIITLITKNTFDERVKEILEGKADMFDQVVNGKIPTADVMSYLGL